MPALYASIGRELTHWALDEAAGTLERRSSVQLPQSIQYVWPHVSKQFLYVGSSDAIPRSRKPDPSKMAGAAHHLSAWRVAGDGSLTPHGNPVALPHRPVHLCTDRDSRFALVAFNRPSGLRVYAIHADGTLGGEVAQPGPVDGGIFAHQVRVTADNRLAILVTRGYDPEEGKPEEPGALKVFRVSEGRLHDCVSIAPDGGYGFGARHLDFHPTRPWVYVSIERQNQMMMFRRDGDALAPAPAFVKDTLAEPAHIRSPQQAGTVHVHPRGHVVYGVNRAYIPVPMDGRMVLPGGENSLVVYSIDPATGEPVAIQHEDTRGVYCRTFHIAPGGSLLVAGNLQPLDVLEGDTVRHVPASLALFRIAADGRLSYLRKYDVEVGSEQLYWMGIL